MPEFPGRGGGAGGAGRHCLSNSSGLDWLSNFKTKLQLSKIKPSELLVREELSEEEEVEEEEEL